MDCELCGSDKAFRKAVIEGAVLCVCDNCVNLGEEVKEAVKPVARKSMIPLPEELNQILIHDFANVIKKAREKRGLKQDELAKKINIRASLVKRMEEGWEPSFVLVRKLEKFFNVKLIERIGSGKVETKADKSRLTIGDIVEIGE